MVGGEDRLRILLGASWPSCTAGSTAIPPCRLRSSSSSSTCSSTLGGRGTARAASFPRAELLAGEPRGGLRSALDAALTVAGTDLGNVQLLDAAGVLRISAQRGFEPPFLDFFAEVKGLESACGVALMLDRQFAVADVEAHELFRGTPAGQVILAAGARAVESTPIMDASGAPIGMLSVHHRFRVPRCR